MYRAIGILCLTILLAGCVASQPAAQRGFNAAEAEFAKARGAGTVKGQLFLRRKDGVVVYGAGSEVRLVPRTAHSEEAVTNSFKGGKLRLEMDYVSAAELRLDPGLEAYSKRIKADGQGNFTFEGVPPGRYFVLGRVSWCAPGAYGSCNKQGGEIMESLELKGADRVITVVMDGALGPT
jgi:hypothetical protein